MARQCYFCGKKPVAGRTIARRGLAKKKGGGGQKTLSKTRRRFMPNLRTVRALIDGSPERIQVCTKCLKAGRVIKSP